MDKIRTSQSHHNYGPIFGARKSLGPPPFQRKPTVEETISEYRYRLSLLRIYDAPHEQLDKEFQAHLEELGKPELYKIVLASLELSR